MKNLEKLALFWEKVSVQDRDFSEAVLKRLWVLSYAPNGMWTYLTTVYFLVNSDEQGNLEQEKFASFLNKITAFIFAFAVFSPGVNALRTPVYPAMVDIVKGKDVYFEKHKFKEQELRSKFDSFVFYSNRPITKSMLAWWVFRQPNQGIMPRTLPLQIEHIYSRSRANKEPLKEEASLELLGNKSLLEAGINIRASDYRFEDKTKYYEGFTSADGSKREATVMVELREIGRRQKSFEEKDIMARNNLMITSFIEHLKDLDLIV